MNTSCKFVRTRAAVTIAALATCLPVALNAQSNQNQTRQSSAQTSSAKQVKIMRATNHLGADVMASDGSKVGDITDFVFNLSGDRPQLSHVIITTGGFLSFGGEARAVPAHAVRSENNSTRIDITSDKFWDVPLLPEDRTRFLTNSENRQRIQSAFPSASSSTTRSSEQLNEQEILTFSELRSADVYGQNGDRLGFAVDAWVNLNSDRVPYIEINPNTFNPFSAEPYYLRYALPLASFAPDKSETGQLTFNLTSDQLQKAGPVSDTEAVQMVESGFVGEKVLQVRLQPRGSQSRANRQATE